MDNSKPAFPSSCDVRIGDVSTSGHSGMTLRQWYAGMAMQGIMSIGISNMPYSQVAHIAFETADAMIKAEETK